MIPKYKKRVWKHGSSVIPCFPLGADPKKSWLKACRAADVQDLHFHDLRHEAGSRLLEQGWPLHHVQRMLGHEDAKTTSIYLNATIHGLAESMRRFGTGAQALPDLAKGEAIEPPATVQQRPEPIAKTLIN